MTKKNIGLYFGSFNPIHIGHMVIANYIIEYSDLDNIWFVVSPHSPTKKKETLLDDYKRLELVHLAIGDNNKFKPCDIEFSMAKPSYTIDTLTYLKEKYPKTNFSIIMGADNWETFHKWKNADKILELYKIYVYPRHNHTFDNKGFSNVYLINAPLMEISSSFIRNSIKEGKDVSYFMPLKVSEYIKEMHLYEK